MKRQTLTQIYFPEKCVGESGYLVGWVIRGFVCCVIGVYSLPFGSIQGALSELTNSLQILGVLNEPDPKTETLHKRNTADI